MAPTADGLVAVVVKRFRQGDVAEKITKRGEIGLGAGAGQVTGVIRHGASPVLAPRPRG